MKWHISNMILSILLVIAVATVQAQFKKPVHKIIPLEENADVGEPLILTSLLEENKLEEARNLSEVHYDGFQGKVSYAGYFTVNKVYNSSLYFWFFPSENNYTNDPVVLWLQGGPGSPSLYALFSENGPFIVDSNQTVSLREYSWTKNHSVIYIDSPAGTGFSFTNEGGWAQNQTQVGEDLYQALQQFFTLFPELQKNDFFVSGESYGGKYVPAIGHAIQIHNPTGKVFINLKGLLIGNGMTDPINQMDYGDYVYQLGLVDTIVRDTLKNLEIQAKKAILEGDYHTATEVMNGAILDAIATVSGISSIYNYIELDEDDLDSWESFVQNPEVRKAIHVGNTTLGDDHVWQNLYDDITKSVAPWVIELLNEYRVLTYNGQLDVIVAYPLTANYLQHLNYSSAEEYKLAPRSIWVVDNEVAGYVKTAGNLTECLVRNAGHMVPLSQPKWSSDLVYKFTRHISLHEGNN